MKLANKSVVITGAGSGVGRASALRFAAEGAKVVCADLREDWAAETVRRVEKAAGVAIAQRCDAAVEADVEAARPPRSHLGFGSGPHVCLGMHVARAELHTAIRALIERLPKFRRDPGAEPPRIVGMYERGPTSLDSSQHLRRRCRRVRKAGYAARPSHGRRAARSQRRRCPETRRSRCRSASAPFRS